ncbi:hypothetical protein [Leptospira noguchii]|uniref:Uncharacterized protein n=1 Tax=Leptospira noguchii TaxID=28182 RepID=M6VNV0_9LEPT|nr:hypothetical protein [Leptospira noguchii]EMO54739.1 hypothetical protein LEP1GSC172_4311 [Leptospira noguchii]
MILQDIKKLTLTNKFKKFLRTAISLNVVDPKDDYNYLIKPSQFTSRIKYARDLIKSRRNDLRGALRYFVNQEIDQWATSKGFKFIGYRFWGKYDFDILLKWSNLKGDIIYKYSHSDYCFKKLSKLKTEVLVYDFIYENGIKITKIKNASEEQDAYAKRHYK